MVEFVILGPHGCGKHRLAKALKCWRIFRHKEQYPQDSSGAFLSRYWVEPYEVGAHIVFAHASGTSCIFKVYTVLHGLELRIGQVEVRDDAVVSVGLADIFASRLAESWMSSSL